MKTKKLVFFNIFMILVIAITLYSLLGGAAMAQEAVNTTVNQTLSNETNQTTLKDMIPTLVILGILFVVNTLVSVSYAASYAITKKNLLRVSSLLLLPVIGLSVVQRVNDGLVGIYSPPAIITTVLYFILLLVVIFISRDLYRLVQRIFNN